MIGKLAELVLFGIAPLFLGGLLLPGALAAAEMTVEGEVFYRERIALPPNAVVEVKLMDVSLADAPATIIAEQKIEPAGQVPVAFVLKFDPTVIQSRQTYAVQARITVDNRLWFITDQRYAVDPLNPEPQKMMLKMVREARAAPSLFGATWLAEDIDGAGVIDNAQTTFSVAADGKVAGSGGCNRYFAEAEVKGDAIKVGKAGATMMACAPALMDQERKFFAALERVASYRIDAGQGKLFLVDAGGADILRFARMD
ncbi:YbaY family lipoprotein [Mesorhizobium sp. ZMM04-5]|uniref:YbaY family lipoprotein n=1 Tax=Mesorhizobium marinum TaxID=3228790 RepID=A0ABV3R2H5_9HYPH